jgi:acyl-CoA dehydrogenase
MIADPAVADVAASILRSHRTSEWTVAPAGGVWAHEAWDALAEGGFPWVGLPADRGGVGGTLADACAVLVEVGRVAAPLPLGETGLLGGWLLAAAGLEIPSGPVTVAPSNVLALTSQGGRSAISGTLDWVAWSGEASRIVALAADDNATLFVVSVDPARASACSPGYNLAGEPRSRLGFDAVEVDGADVAAAPPGVDLEAQRRRGALSRACLIAGACEATSELILRHASTRVQFGRPIARFQSVGQHLARVAEQTQCVRMATGTAAANAADAADYQATLDVFDVAAAKTVAAEAASSVSALAHQVAGAIGVTLEFDLGHFTRRLWSWRAEYGGQKYWSQRLGEHLVAAGPAALWPRIATGYSGA